MKRILLVDDEQNVLNALRRELAGTYEVETFISPQEALRRAKETDFALVVSDYRMPDMDGVTFLENFGQMQPDAVRLILSGQADMDALIKAVNVTHIYRFLSKPWSETDLKANILQGLDYREAILENRRFAEDYRQRFGTPPQQQERKLYRVLLVCTDENAATSMWRELTHHSAYEGLYGAIRYEMTHRPTYGGHDFQLIVDSSASPREAMERLENNGYDLAIADFSMPEMNGVAFFDKLRQAGADTAFVLVGENLDMPTLTYAINQVHIDSILKHTWNGYELKSAVMRALRYRDLLQENRSLANLLREVENPG
ncbi:MAG: response regulator [Betaproteobacteria bacterium]|nr:MAG: response regulator [Betaproteobacteria bacterium]